MFSLISGQKEGFDKTLTFHHAHMVNQIISGLQNKVKKLHKSSDKIVKVQILGI